MKQVIVIPARMSGTRLPGKPLKLINGMPMIWHVWSKCKEIHDPELIYIATEDLEIEKYCAEMNINCVNTGLAKTAVDRIKLFADEIIADSYINVQGDEPIFDPHDLKKLIRYGLKNPSVIVSGYCEINEERMYNDLNVPKVVLDKENYLMYASRAPIPSNKKAKFISANRQICAYSFPKETLKIFSTFKKKTYLESIEDIEYLRFLEVGIKIKCIKMSGKSLAVDNSYDLNVVSQIIKKNEKNYG